MSLRTSAGVIAAAMVGVGSVVASAAQLHTNGPVITSANGGTGAIAGQPLSKTEPFTLPSGSNVNITGFGASFSGGGKLADDFTVPAGGWDVDQFRVYAYQTFPSSATTFSQTITKVRLNLWTATPYTSDSPDLPPGTTIPQPVLASPIEYDVVGQGAFVAHRVSGISTTTVRPIYSFTIDANLFPNAGRLDAGTYWLEMSFEGQGQNTNLAFVPQVTPRSAVTTNFNTRQFAIPFANFPASWFEAREVYQSEAQPGRAVALPFEVLGTALPEPVSLGALAGGLMWMGRLRRGE